MERAWTLEGARAVIADVRARTARAVEESEALALAREGASADALAGIEEKLEGVLSRWAREIEALGAEAKGVWLVDFDTGDGYYCWRWPEETLAWFHSYESGFDGRQRIQ